MDESIFQDLTDDEMHMLRLYVRDWHAEALDAYRFVGTLEAWDILYDFSMLLNLVVCEEHYREARESTSYQEAA